MLGSWPSRRISATTDKDIPLSSGLLNPHYSNKRFQEGDQTAFLAPGYTLVTSASGTESVPEAQYEYSDSLRQWHGKKCDEAWAQAEAKGFAPCTPALMEAYLQELLGDPDLQLVHLVTGVNRGNGYPYRVYGYISRS